MYILYYATRMHNIVLAIVRKCASQSALLHVNGLNMYIHHTVPEVMSVVAVAWSWFPCWLVAQTSVQQPTHLQHSAQVRHSNDYHTPEL